MSSAFGSYLRLSLFGQSHGPAIGITIDGLPAGMTIDMEALCRQMARRAPGRGSLSTKRSEADEAEFLSGVLDGVTTGQPLCAVIRSTGMRPQDYAGGVDLLRPGHADYSGHVRYFGFEDWRGGGSFSGRLTAPIVLCGALCRQYLKGQGVEIAAHVLRVGDVEDSRFPEDMAGDFAPLMEMELPVLDAAAGEQMRARIRAAAEAGDSLGGEVECAVTGLPAGLGAPFFDSVESVLSHLLFSIPAVKGVGFGGGFALARMKGSEANDPFAIAQGRIVTEGNRAGGVNGGITNGMPVVFTCAFRPTPSIARPQQTVSLQRMEAETLSIRGRHDPCVVPRAVPVVEAMAAIGVMELWKERQACLQSSPTRE